MINIYLLRVLRALFLYQSSKRIQLAKIKILICEPYRMVNKAKGDAIKKLKLRYAFTVMRR